MDQKNNLLSSLFSTSSHYIDLQGKSVRLGIYQKSTDALTTAFQLLVLALLAVVTYLFLNIALAFVLGSATGSIITGFFIMGGINLIFFVIYAFARHKLGKKAMQNSILHGISGSLKDYEGLLREQEQLQGELEIAKQNLRTTSNEVKEKLAEMESQISRLKEQLTGGLGSGEGQSFARTAVTTGIDILLNTFFLKNAGILKRTLVPVITNAFVTSRLFKEKKKNSVLENLKSKMRNLIR